MIFDNLRFGEIAPRTGVDVEVTTEMDRCEFKGSSQVEIDTSTADVKSSRIREHTGGSFDEMRESDIGRTVRKFGVFDYEANAPEAADMAIATGVNWDPAGTGNAALCIRDTDGTWTVVQELAGAL